MKNRDVPQEALDKILVDVIGAVNANDVRDHVLEDEETIIVGEKLDYKVHSAAVEMKSRLLGYINEQIAALDTTPSPPPASIDPAPAEKLIIGKQSIRDLHSDTRPPCGGIDPADVAKLRDELGKIPLTCTNIAEANKQKWATVDALTALIEAAGKQVPSVNAWWWNEALTALDDTLKQMNYTQRQTEGYTKAAHTLHVARQVKASDPVPMVPLSEVDTAIAVVRGVAAEYDRKGELGKGHHMREAATLVERETRPRSPAPKPDADKPRSIFKHLNEPDAVKPCPDCTPDATEPCPHIHITYLPMPHPPKMRCDDCGEVFPSMFRKDIKAARLKVATEKKTASGKQAACPVCEKNKAEIHATQLLVHLAAKIMSSDYTEKELALYDALEADAERKDGGSDAK